jgi:hypothetical protein
VVHARKVDQVLVRMVLVERVLVERVLVDQVQVHIDHNQEERHVPEVLVDQVAQDNVLEQVEHLEKVAERRRVIRAKRLSAKRSTIWKRPRLVAR